MTESEFKKEIGTYLKDAREAGNMTQSEIASKINVSKNHVSAIERGQYVPSIEIVMGYANALSTTPDVILHFKSTIIPELYDSVKNLSRDEQLKIADIIKILNKK